MVWNSARTTFCALLGVLALTTTAPTTAQAANPPCPDFPPVLSLQLVGIYTDARQSVPDAAAEKKNSDLTAGVDQFLRSNEQVLARPAQARQEIPGDWGYRVPIGFGADLLDENWSRCGRPHASLSDPTSGGDTQHAATLLKQLAQAAARPAP